MQRISDGEGDESHARNNLDEDYSAEMMEVEIEQAGLAVGWDTGLVQETKEMSFAEANPQLGESIEMIIDDDYKGSHDSGDTSFSEKTDRELFGCEA
jgi:hypothetical protein